MAEGFLATRLEVNDNLPAAVSYLNLENKAVGGAVQVLLTWGNPTEQFAGVMIVRKTGSAPTSLWDGEKIYEGAAASYTDGTVTAGVSYSYRVFPYNSRRQVQTLGPIQSITPVLSIHPSDIPYEGVLKLTEATQGEQKYHKWGNAFLREKVQPTTYANTTWSNRTAKVLEIVQKELPGLVGQITSYGCQTRSSIDAIWYMGSSSGRMKTPSNSSSYVAYFIEKEGSNNLVDAANGLLEAAGSSSKHAVSISISLDESVQIQAATDWEGCYQLA